MQLEHPPKLLNGQPPENQLEQSHNHYNSTFDGHDYPRQLPARQEECVDIKLTVQEVRHALSLIDVSKSYERHYHYKFLPEEGINLLTKIYNAWLSDIIWPTGRDTPTSPSSAT